ncbi:uncharacterized protein MYCGRDRAFT_28473, partial [Zymoseptoria tritici IPO323]
LPHYRHIPLENPAIQIRLLKATPTLRYNTDLVSHARAPRYNAISHTWGEPKNNTTIVVDERPLTVRQNCYDALLQAHRFDRHIYLWIDAICINQADDEEKSCQVHRMHDIYLWADHVLACLGE